MSKPVAIGEAKTNLSRLVERAEAGEDVVIRRGNTPVAKLVRYTAPKERSPFGILEGRIRISDNFDDPIPDFEPYIDPTG